ncbi:MAG: hypothetical protein OXI24_12740, partial [Candidatus Poribacteria bacterium]|nr:hypothetical protein [Candidatus Poribacteria bacterium]
MVQIAPLDRFHLPQVMDLVNSHLSTVIPGWSLTPDYFWEHLKRNPREAIVDPWVVERKSIVGIVKDRVCAAAHLLRYGDDTRWRGVGEIDWILFWPGEREAGEVIMTECRRQMNAWQVLDERISGTLPVHTCVGIPKVWPHIADLIERFGYSSNREVDSTVYGGTLNEISSPGEPPVRGVTIHRDVGKFGT